MIQVIQENHSEQTSPDAARWDPVEGWSGVNSRGERVDDPFMQFGVHN